MRPLHSEDWPALREIRLHALQTEPGVFTSSYERERDRGRAEWESLASGDQGRCIFGAFDLDALVGISGVYTATDAAGEATAVFVMSYVLPAYRGRGLARRFFEERLAWVRARPHFVRVHVWHRRTNERIGRTIRRFGFRETAVRSQRWPDGTEGELVECELAL